jgi:HK97 gp10 family phage protein
VTMTWNQSALADLKRDSRTTSAMLQDGWEVARVAALLAPKRTGQSARSIRAELVTVGGVPEVRISWDKDHFWMGFAELGTQHQRATPFLRPAAARYQ